MESIDQAAHRRIVLRRLALGAAVWAAAWLCMVWLDGHVDLANLAMVLVLASASATLWLPVGVSLVASTVAVLAFNWIFVPPRGTLTVDLRQDALLLTAMLVVSWIVAAIMALQRATAERSRVHAKHVDQLRRLGDALRDVADPTTCASLLQATLADLVGGPVMLLLLTRLAPPADDPTGIVVIGTPTPDQRTGLWLCARNSTPFGPGTGRHAELPEWYLPLRGRETSLGAAAITLADPAQAETASRTQAQALCDQMGLALERFLTAAAASAAREQAQTQSVRNAMLAAISHDYRTPLATIMSAASSLAEQGERLDPNQRHRLAQTIVEESAQLSRLTDNTLQLARLDAPGVRLQLDWESAEEIVGAILRRARRHDPHRRVRARLEAGLPLVRCDALLLAQLLDNLVDNALKYSDAPSPVEILVRRQAGQLVFAVRDRGRGVAPAWRERIFDVFQRGDTGGESLPAQAVRRGAGVGLAVCRAIARAHGGELRLRARGHGGSSFECWLPEVDPPRVEPETAAGVCK
jgi:two-component system sensor histidine kinase KdpD